MWENGPFGRHGSDPLWRDEPRRAQAVTSLGYPTLRVYRDEDPCIVDLQMLSTMDMAAVTGNQTMHFVLEIAGPPNA